MIQLFIVNTGKGYSPKDDWRRFDSQTKNFANLKDAKEFLKETYGRCKRVPMFVDTKDGKPKKVGWVFGFRNSGWGSGSQDKWIQQDWVEFREVKSISPEGGEG